MGIAHLCDVREDRVPQNRESCCSFLRACPSFDSLSPVYLFLISAFYPARSVPLADLAMSVESVGYIRPKTTRGRHCPRGVSRVRNDYSQQLADNQFETVLDRFENGPTRTE